MKLKLKIGQKLLLGYLVIGLLLILTLYISLTNYRQIDRNYRKVISQNLPAVMVLYEIGQYTSQTMIFLHEYLKGPEEKHKIQFEEHAAKIEESLKAYEKAEAGEKEEGVIREMTQLIAELKKEGRYLMNLVDQGVSGKIIEEREESVFHPLHYRLEDLIGKELKHDVGEFNEAEALTSQTIGSAINVFVFIIFILLLINASSYFITRGIVSSIRKLHQGTERIGKGDWDYRVDIKTGDEVERLANEFNLMASRLASFYRELEEKVKERTKELDAANQQLKASEQQLRAGNQQLRAASQALTEERASLEIKVKARTQELSQISGQLRSLLESMKLGVLMVDLSFNVILANSAAKLIFGKLPGESITFQELEEKLKGVNLSQALSYYVKDAKPLNVREVMIENRYFHIFLSPVRSIAERLFIGAVIVLEDITERKMIDKMRTEIVSVTSHQLRTPLSVIKGNLEMVLEGDAGKITKEQKEILQEAFWGNERMINLVNNLMDISKIEEGRFEMKFEPTQFEKLIGQAVVELEPLAKKNKVILEYRPPTLPLPKVNIDQARIKQVIQNLVDNAIKYSRIDTRGKVLVEIQKEKEGKFFRVSVQDNGAGIPRDEQEKIFGRFFRASNISKLDPGGGSGLGLYIVKAIIEQSGGRIWFESEGEGKGTTFYFTLPIK